jgi:hypothetical protein
VAAAAVAAVATKTTAATSMTVGAQTRMNKKSV